MKNFSQTLGTEHHIITDIKIRPISENGNPSVTISVNDKVLYSGEVLRHLSLSTMTRLLDPLTLTVKLENKIYDTTRETALVIDSIMVDQIDITDHCYKNIIYDNDQKQSVQSMYLGFNGTWVMTIPEPFYRWWHRESGQGWLLEPTYSMSSRVQR